MFKKKKRQFREGTSLATIYEKFQEADFITRYLHKTRFYHLKKITKKLSLELNRPINIIDIGCGSSKAYQEISSLGIKFNYKGIEIDKDFVKYSRRKFSKNKNYEIVHDDIKNHYDILVNADLIIALESLEHIKENIVFRIIERISSGSFKYLYITVPNEIGIALLIKNIGSIFLGYQRGRGYSISETFYALVDNLDKINRVYEDHKGFDWRWLAQTLRVNLKIIKTTTSPFEFIPKFISPSIGFICKSNSFNK